MKWGYCSEIKNLTLKKKLISTNNKKDLLEFFESHYNDEYEKYTKNFYNSLDAENDR